MKKKNLILWAFACATALSAQARSNIAWPKYAKEVIKIFQEHGGSIEGAQYAYYDYDNDGQEELVVYNYCSEDDPHACVFSVSEEKGLQLITDVPSPRFYYIPNGEGAYTIFPNQDHYINLTHSTVQPGEVMGDGDNMCQAFHGRRKDANCITWGNPLYQLKDEGDYDMTPYSGEVSVFNFNEYWYRKQPKVKGSVSIESFFHAICDAINMPMLKTAQKAVRRDKAPDATTVVDAAAGYIQWKAPSQSELTEERGEDRIECCYWKRPGNKHIVALNYHIQQNGDFQWGDFRNLVFWEYDAQTSSLVPVPNPYERLWMVPNLNYDINIELPRKGRDIKVTDNDTGEQYLLQYQYDENLITFWNRSVLEESILPWQKGLMCSIYDTTGTPTNIRLTPGGQKSQYQAIAPGNLVIAEQKNGYFRVIDNMIEDWTDDCDNVQFMDDNRTGYWIHYSCLAVKSRHKNGTPLQLLKEWDDCNEQPVTYTIKSETKLRPLEITPEGWVKVQTLDGKHSGWTTKDKLGACVTK